MECVFCRIASGGLPAYTVFEDERLIAFLDSHPVFPGHCLLIPKRHVETLSDLPSELVGPLFAGARVLAKAVETGLGAEGSFVAVNNRISQTVPHLHVHVVPRKRKDGLKGFFWPRHPYSGEEEMREVQSRLKAAIQAEGADRQE